jgi:transketolase
MAVVMAKEQKPIEMRAVYQQALVEILREHPQVVVMDADLVGASGTAKVFKEFPDRCINMGISEANMIGAAAGMSLVGKVPIIHTFAPFATRRVYDQLYLSGAYQKANLRIYGSDPGFTSGHNGGTHTSVEDLALMRAMPTATVLAPADATQFAWLLKETSKMHGIFYMRASRKGLKDIYDPASTFEIGKGIVLSEGSDVVIFAIGEMIEQALLAKEELENSGVSVAVVDMFTVKPIDRDLIERMIIGKKLVVTAENHSKIGGLGSAVAEIMAESGCGVPLRRIAIQDRFGEVGLPDYLQKTYGLTKDDIIQAVKEVIK